MTEPLLYRLIGASEEAPDGDLLHGLATKEARQRLQALIAEWLGMENLVVLTGSGCSVSANGKTMADLETAVLSTVAHLPGISPALTTILNLRLADVALGSGGGPSFEEWLSFVVNAHALSTNSTSPFNGVQWKGDTSPSAAELKWLIDWCGRAIFAECSLVLPSASAGSSTMEGLAPHLAFLAKLVARDSNLGRAHLFTLNYDTLFEQALELLGIQYFDGFSGRANARFDPSVYGLDVYYPGEIAEGRVRRFDKFLHFYKLHGSIHWHVDQKELRARHPDLSLFEGYRALKPDQSTEKAAWLHENGSKIPALGILPTANKFAQTLTMPFAHLFRSFQIRLSAPQTFLLVLGYGFGDDHVTRVIETALLNPSLVMLVVEPKPDSPTIARIRGYKDLGKRAFVLTPTDAAFAGSKWTHATFDDFSRSVMPDVQWLNDFLKLRRFEKQIQASIGAPPGGADG